MLGQLTVEAIAAIFGLIASVITLFITRYLDSRPLKSLDRHFRDEISGTWRGRVRIPEHPWQVVRADFILSLKASRKVVIGDASLETVAIQPGANQPTEMTNKIVLRGGVFEGRFLRLEYRNARHAVLQFGSLVLRLADDASELQGKFIGYGAYSKTMLTGSVELKKVLE